VATERITRKKLVTGLVVICVVIAILFAVSMYQIFSSVRAVCRLATERYPGDNVEALMAMIEAEDSSYREKNRAIWALGQIGDERALPLLRKLDTDEPQPKPYDTDSYIVQYSVEKAIRQIEDGFIMTRWMYYWL
jgi:hypothetical protein